jgi:quinol monooxygenase YgiN
MPKVELIVRWVAKPGSEQALHDVLKAMLQPTHAEPGEKVYDLYQSADGRQFWFVEEWPTEASFEFHKQSPHLKNLGPATESLVEGPAEVTFVKKLEV